MRKLAAYVTLVTVTGGLIGISPLTARQGTALTVFLAVIYGTLFFWEFRLAFALLGLGTLLTSGVLDVPHLIEYAGLDIILFLISMMILIGFLEENHFFEYVVEKIAAMVNRSGVLLVSVLMAVAALFAALVDEVTSILFMTSTALNIARRAKLQPFGLIMMIVFATNVGSSATAVGNPIGVMIALRAHLTFVDFLNIASPLALLALGITIGFCLLWFKQDTAALTRFLRQDRDVIDEMAEALERAEYPTPRRLVLSWGLFLGTMGLLVMHAKFEELLGLDKNILLLAVAFFAAGVSLLVHRKEARQLVSRRVDWWTLAFFLILFATVGALKNVGISAVVSEGFAQIAGGDPRILFAMFSSATAILTAFMDNVLAVATFIPVVEDLAASGFNATRLWWAMLLAGTIFGNCTIIGSTANIVAMGVLEREKYGAIGFWQWLKPGFLVSLLSLGTVLVVLYLRLT